MNKKVTIAIIAVLTLLLVATSGLCVLLYSEKRTIEDSAESLDSELAEYRKKADELRLELNDAEKKLDASTDDFKDSLDSAMLENERLNGEIDRLGQVLDTRTSAPKKLDQLTSITDSIVKFATSASPLVRVTLDEEEYSKRLETDPDAADHYFAPSADYTKKLLDKYGKVSEYLPLSELIDKENVEAPRVAVYYLDLLGGYEYSFCGDDVFDSASVMKAPFVTAILLEMEKNESLTKAEAEADNKLTYDALEEKIVLDHEIMDVSGSGVLKNAPDGGEYTYLELMELAIKNSDNIAFDQLKKRFGSDAYFNFARECNAGSPFGYIMNLTPREAGEMFRRVYLYTQKDGKYSKLMKDWLCDSAHLVLSKSALGSSNVLHKYGWDIDAYHDVAIVLGERPYIAAVFTNLDCGGAETDNYVRSIFGKIRELHEFICE